MALFARFKKQKKQEASAPQTEKAEKPRVQELLPDRPKGGEHTSGFSLIPHVTEKTTAGAHHRWYAFRVPTTSGKVMVKQAVESRYGVRVMSVRTVRISSRRVRIGRVEGRVPGFKKAMVKLKEGQSIEVS